MKKVYILLFSLVFIILYIGLKFIFISVADSYIQTTLATLHQTPVHIQTDIKQNTCWFFSCLTLENTRINAHGTSWDAGSIQIRFFPLYPYHISIHSINSNTQNISIHAIIHHDQITLHHLIIDDSPFKTDISGSFDIQTKELSGKMHTQHLHSFLMPFIPQQYKLWASLFVSNQPQSFTISQKNNWVLLNDFPLIPLNIFFQNMK